MSITPSSRDDIQKNVPLSKGKARIGSMGSKSFVEAKNRPSTGWYALAIGIGIFVIASGCLGAIGFKQLTDLHWSIEAILGGSVLIAYAAYQIHQIHRSDASNLKKSGLDEEVGKNVKPSSNRLSTTREGRATVTLLGYDVWERNIGDVQNEPDLPENIEDILDGKDPYDSRLRIRDTHILALIPTTLNREPLTLNKLCDLIQSPQRGRRGIALNGYKGLIGPTEGGDVIETPYWVLLRKSVIPESRNQSFEQQQQLISEHAHEGFEMPTLLEVIVGNILHFKVLGEYLYGNDPRTYTRCVRKADGDPIVAGLFCKEGGFNLESFPSTTKDTMIGVADVIRLKP